MQRIAPNIWFKGTVKEAMDFYCSVFPHTTASVTSRYPTEGLLDFQKDLAGKELTINIDINGFTLTGINAGPEFTPTPSLSFFVNIDPLDFPEPEKTVRELWNNLMDGGMALMPLQEYPFSKLYGWVQDKYGVSWQIIVSNPQGEKRPFIVPSLMFSGDNTNKAEEAMQFYISLFQDSAIGAISRYPDDIGPAKKGSIMYSDFHLGNIWFAGMDSGVEHAFNFTEGVSLSVACKDQEEIDRLWEALSTVPAAEQCGWCKDKYGVSWQIVPEHMGELMKKPQAFEHMMQMKKIVIADF